MPPKEKYTDPKLRDQVKQEIQDSDKGGAPGQWSARKAQMMAAEYKKRGGNYNTDKSQQDESQKNLSKWGEEEWQTKEGSGDAKKEDGTQKRYLPKKAWETMSEEEKQATEERKQEGSKQGKQFVQNTGEAKKEREKVNEDEDEQYGKKQDKKQNGDDESEEEEADDATAAEDDDSEEDYDEEGDDSKEDREDDEEEGKDGEDEDKKKPSAGQKRKQPSKNSSSNKKQKSAKEGETGNAPPGKVGSKHMDAAEPGQRGSADRLPKKGASVTWKAMPGYVDGTLEEVLTKQKSVNGKSVKASKDDPRLVLKSNSSGKICVHKPDACFYD